MTASVPLEASVRAGREGRRLCPRASHGEWEAAPARRDPIAVLEEQAVGRVPELVPIRHARMAASPFAFYRGAAALMAADLVGTPATGIRVQLCGDAHVGNFGGYASPERRQVFDVNDFDETLPGPWEWDLKRLVASIAIAGRERGLDGGQRRDAMRAAAARYRTTMAGFATMPTIDGWYAHIDASQIVGRLRERDEASARAVERSLDKARTRNGLRALERFTRPVGGEPRIISDPPLIVPVAEIYAGAERAQVEEGLARVLAGYRRTLAPDRRRLLDGYRLVDVARKVVGVGSVGTRCWIALLLGRDDRDPLFLQFKETGPSALEPFAGASPFSNAGRRVVEGQRMMQAASDVLLGWHRTDQTEGAPRDYYGRQLWDWKLSPDLERMEPRQLSIFGELCARTLARGHARSGDRVAIAAYLGRGDAFERAAARFGETYADQNERDHRALVDAIRDGRIAAA